MAELIDALEVETAPDPEACLIWMHGLGADGRDLVPVARALDLPAALRLRFVFPHAPMRPVTINQGAVMRAWYDVVPQDGLRQEVEAGVRASQAQIEALIERERGRGIAPARIVLAGFSQGGAMALQTGLRYRARLGGVAALSCFLPLSEPLGREASAENRDVPVFMAHGIEDSVIPLARGQASRDRLLELGYRLTWREYPMAHAVCDAEIRDLAQWLSGLLGPA